MPSNLGNDLALCSIVGAKDSLLLPRDSRDEHLDVVGATGAGKSKFLENLIRQDIINWRNSKCGLLPIDPHGSLYDGLMAWMAWHNIDRPIVPIDLRRDDWVISYNVLRKRKADPAVLVDNLIDAMAHVWGQAGTDSTPLFARWAGNVLRALYEKGHTLVEANFLIDRLGKQLRYAMTANLEDKPFRNDWLFSQTLTPKEFESQIGSTVNRFQRSLRNETMKTIFGQPEVSMDLGNALDEGSIILVNLATEGAQVSRENVELLATILLSDLWTAAQERGKKKGVKPFYLYLDEFQRFVTPTIAENLDEARGFGLHLTLAHQFPNQLLDRGDDGKRVFNSIMENASSKVVFRLSHEENLKILAQWLFMGVMDPDEIKHQLYSTKLMGYVEEMRQSFGETESFGSSSGSQQGRAGGRGRGGTESFRTGDNESHSRSESVSAFESGSESETRSESRSKSTSESWSPVLLPIMGKELSSVQFRSLEEQLHRSMAVLFDHKQRQCVARLVGMRAPVSLFTPTILEVPTNEVRSTAHVAGLNAKLPFALVKAEATKRLKAREAAFPQSLMDEVAVQMEPRTAKRILS